MYKKIKMDIQLKGIQEMIDKSNRLVEILEEAKAIQKELQEMEIDIAFNSSESGRREDI
ncbi:hypothetical protein [uncultured Trichococcus sp.]|uniref:hypothetical protein n=1 Tax=Trichococcus flocculiformis TaxID=82803 RepID=UPI0029C0CC91|nr:hypothetical protein [uncultured Trichococcus sp.]